MSALIYGKSLTKAHGVNHLFADLTLSISEKDRIGIIGPNGSGKTTLLKILAGLEQPDLGSVTRRQYLRIGYVPQQVEFNLEGTVAGEIERAALASGIDPHECIARVQETLGRTGFEDGSQSVAPLSGGWRKRLAIACGMVQSPDVMLLDEPTNHLDLEGMRWLEHVMSQAPWPWVMVSHDRWFLEQATNQIAEINTRYPDGIFLVNGTYAEFIRQREAFHQTQTQQAQTLAGKVRREVEWLRRSPKARTTKAKYRVAAAHSLQAELSETATRLKENHTSIDFVGSDRKTKQLIQVTGLTKGFGHLMLIQDLEMILSPGMAMGILGHNGSGKSTLLKLLAKELNPDRGMVKHAEKLEIVYFDQNRDQLDPQKTLRRTLSDTGQTVTYRGETIHLAGWAKRFRFQPEQLDLPVERLSGGEQARAVMARLMLKPADVLIVDEPTNDLDIPTREVLEESLLDFPGALVLVTHDRYMLSQVCTQFIGLDGRGAHGQFAEYQQWEGWLRQNKFMKEPVTTHPRTKNSGPLQGKLKKLSYKEQKEYDTIEQRILEAENAVAVCRDRTGDPTIATEHIELEKAYDRLKTAEQKVERLYARWGQLENKRQGVRQQG